jgi:TonB family protein
MTFSGIAVEQRSKETEALRSFLVYSLIGSVVLHIGILTIGINNLLRRNSEVDNEPLEVTLIETPPVETKPTPEEIEPEPKIAPPPPKVIPEVNNTRVTLAPEPKPQAIAPVAVTPVKLKTEPVPKVSQNLKTPQVQQATAPRVLTTQPTNTQPATTQVVEPSSNKLRGLLSGIRDARTTQGNTSTDNSSNTGSNITVGSGNTNNSLPSLRRSRGSEAVSTAPSPVKIDSPPSSNNTRNDSPRAGNGRAACRECVTNYPEAARRRGIEGNVKVAVDTDDKGNVTNVRIVNSSGNRDLDEETLRQARNWKLKPSASGRTGVAIDTEYAIQGSRRYREVQERKRQRQRERQAQARQQAASSTPSSRESNNTNSSSSTNTENRTRRRRLVPTSQPSTASTTNTRTPDNQRSVRNSLRRVRRERTATESSTQSQPTVTRQRRRIQTQQTQATSSSSSSRLRNALRRSRQPSQSQSTPETSTPNE